MDIIFFSEFANKNLFIECDADNALSQPNLNQDSIKDTNFLVM